MPQSQEERNQPQNSFLASPIMQTPLIAIVAEMNGTLLETMATAQKEWANFVDRRIKEDVAVLRQLMQCRSPADMHRVYSDNCRRGRLERLFACCPLRRVWQTPSV